MNDTEQQPEPAASLESAAPPKPSVAEAVNAFVTDLLAKVDPTAQFHLHENGRNFRLDLNEASGFVGFEGPSIQALEHLIDLHLRRHLREDARIQVDIDNFRQRRTDELNQLATTSAEQAKETNTRIKLEPMTSWERKTVHEALEHVDGVRTHSEGNMERFVVIAPQKPKSEEKPSKNKSESKS